MNIHVWQRKFTDLPKSNLNVLSDIGPIGDHSSFVNNHRANDPIRYFTAEICIKCNSRPGSRNLYRDTPLCSECALITLPASRRCTKKEKTEIYV